MDQFSCGRRAVLGRAMAWAAGIGGCALLASCGGQNGSDNAASGISAVMEATTGQVPLLASAPYYLNLALNFEYMVAQFYSHAATGAGLPAGMLSGAGPQGAVMGARAAVLTDPIIAEAAANLAADKADNVVALRGLLGFAAAAMPTVDLSGDTGGGFGAVARKSGRLSYAGFDPYADESQFLLGASVLEYALAANYRTLFIAVTDPVAGKVLGDVLARSIYHGGLVRTLIDARAATDTSITEGAGALCAGLAQIDGTDAGDQSLAGADRGSANLSDAAGRPLPFMREPAQLLRIAYLSGGATPGAFFPRGLNGIA